jgi:hypothetical protein
MSRVRGAFLAIAGTAALAAGCAHNPPPATSMADQVVARDLERVRNATKAFQDTAAAHAAGYPTATMTPCLSDSSAGGMGHHFVNRALLVDSIDVEHPQILLYGPAPGGTLKLVAVEYIIPYRIHPREAEAPRIFGRALRQNDPLKLWNLHVWAWEENPAGLFAEWNPAVKCPAPKAGG